MTGQYRHSLSRRQAMSTIGAPFALSLLGCAGQGRATDGDAAFYEQRLRAILESIQFSTGPARLDLETFEMQPPSGRKVVMVTQLVLHWPPGMRRRRFTTKRLSRPKAFDQLEGDIRDYFGRLS